MSPSARAALERARKDGAEVRRNAWKRVYRVEAATTDSMCGTTHEEKEQDNLAISGVTTEVRRYRLESITFTDNKVLLNAAALRSLFPIQDGEPFDESKVAEGLQKLKMAYGTQGFASFEASVDPEIDDSHRSIALRIKCEEGPQFYVDHINIAGLDENTFQRFRKNLYVRPGDLYNARLADLWLEKNSRLIGPDNSIRDRVKLEVNKEVGN